MVTVDWLDDEKTVLIYQIYGKWTWEEFYRAFEKARTMMASVPHTVHAITIPRDDAARHHIPSNILTHFPIITRRLPTNAGMAAMVITGFSPLWRSMYNTVVMLHPPFGRRVAMVASEEEGLARIAERKSYDLAALVI
jgi:hypothetical protein